MKKNLLSLVSILVITILLTGQASAQSDPPQTYTGKVTGKVINFSSDEPLPPDIGLMLHASDMNNEQKVMEHGQTDASGNFIFENIPIDPRWSYAIQASYEGAYYYSDSVIPKVDENSLVIDAPFYQITNDISNVRITQMHVLLSPDPDGLRIGEVYILSNQGKFTVNKVMKIDNKDANIRFKFPADAFGLSINSNNAGEFMNTADGYAEIAPITPGEKVRQDIFSYLLTFTDGMHYVTTPPLPVDRISFLVPEEMGITLNNSALVDQGTKTLSEGQVYHGYSLENIASGETIDVELKGTYLSAEPKTVVPIVKQSGQQTQIVIGAAVLAVALIFSGGWLYFRSKNSYDPEEE